MLNTHPLLLELLQCHEITIFQLQIWGKRKVPINVSTNSTTSDPRPQLLSKINNEPQDAKNDNNCEY